MKKTKKKKRTVPRIPIEAIKKLGSRAVTTKKGAKGYDREKAWEEAVRIIEEEAPKG